MNIPPEVLEYLRDCVERDADRWEEDKDNAADYSFTPEDIAAGDSKIAKTKEWLDSIKLPRPTSDGRKRYAVFSTDPDEQQMMVDYLAAQTPEEAKGVT